jgi:hypothetical protein
MTRRDRNQAHPARLLLLLPLVAALLHQLAAADRALGQNTREERCRNNQTRLGELEKQARELERDLSWTDKKIADARTAMVIARKTIRNELAGVEDENEAWQNGSLSGIYARLSRMAKEYNYDVDMCIGSRVDCLRKIPAEIGKHIDRANTLRPHRAEMQQKKVDVDNQIDRKSVV